MTIKLDITVREVPEDSTDAHLAAVLLALHQIQARLLTVESKLDALTDGLLSGPAVRLRLIPGTPIEQPHLPPRTMFTP